MMMMMMMITAQSDDVNNILYQQPIMHNDVDNNVVNDDVSSASSIAFEIGSIDHMSTNTITLVLDIVSLPKHGILMVHNNNTNPANYYIDNITSTTTLITLHPRNHRFPINIGQGMVSLTYQLTDHTYFNVPYLAKDAYGKDIFPYDNAHIESFDFRIRAYEYHNNDSNSNNNNNDTVASSNSINETMHPKTQSPRSFYKLISISSIVTQLIHVVHVNHPGSLIVSNPLQMIVNMYPILPSSTWSTSILTTTTATTTTSKSMTIEAVILSPIQYIDTNDYDMDYVRVDIWVEDDDGIGLLSIHEDGLSLAIFCPTRYSNQTWSSSSRNENKTLLSSWNCHGNGIQNHNMTFVAIPSDIEIILRYLRYESIVVYEDSENDDNMRHQFVDTVDRSIYIRISDGIGDGMCLNEWEQYQLFNTITDHVEDATKRIIPQPTLSMYNLTTTNITTSLVREEKCYQTTTIIPIPRYNSMNTSTGSHLWNLSDPEMDALYPNEGFFDFLNIADVLFWGFVCLLIAACTCLYQKLPRCTARGKAVDVEHHDEDQNNIIDRHPKNVSSRNDNDDDHFSISSGMTDGRQTTPQQYFDTEDWYCTSIASPSHLMGSKVLEAI